MKKTLPLAVLAAVTALSATLPAHALDARIIRQLGALAPDERREQRCDIEAMDRISEEADGFRPDKVIAYTFADPVEKGDSLRAPGAVFRSGGDWYRLKFQCETAEHGLKVKSFTYKIGAKVSRDDWQRYFLYE